MTDEERRSLDIVSYALALKAATGCEGTVKLVVDDPDHPDQEALQMAARARAGGLRVEFVRPTTTISFVGEPKDESSEEELEEDGG